VPVQGNRDIATGLVSGRRPWARFLAALDEFNRPARCSRPGTSQTDVSWPRAGAMTWPTGDADVAAALMLHGLLYSAQPPRSGPSSVRCALRMTSTALTSFLRISSPSLPSVMPRPPSASIKVLMPWWYIS